MLPCPYIPFLPLSLRLQVSFSWYSSNVYRTLRDTRDTLLMDYTQFIYLGARGRANGLGLYMDVSSNISREMKKYHLKWVWVGTQCSLRNELRQLRKYFISNITLPRGARVDNVSTVDVTVAIVAIHLVAFGKILRIQCGYQRISKLFGWWCGELWWCHWYRLN